MKVNSYFSKAGYTELRYRKDGQTIRETVKDYFAATRQKEIESAYNTGKVIPLNAKQSEEYRHAISLLPEGMSLIDAVMVGVKDRPVTLMYPTLTALHQFQEYERDRGVPHETAWANHRRLRSLLEVGELETYLARVKSTRIQTILANITSPKTHNDVRNKLNAFFKWAVARGLHPGPNPVSLCPPRKVPPKDPIPFSPEDLARLFKAAMPGHPSLVLYLALAAFAGIRQKEILRLRRSDLVEDPETGVCLQVRLSSDITKTSRRRVIELPESFAKWCGVGFPSVYGTPQNELLIEGFSNINRSLRALAKKAGVTWVDNGLRKGYVSASYVLHGPALTAQWAGHSVAVLESNYKALFTREQAEAWFNITPDKLR